MQRDRVCMSEVIRNTWHAKRSDCANIFVRITAIAIILPTLQIFVLASTVKICTWQILSKTFVFSWLILHVGWTPFLGEEIVLSALKWIRISSKSVTIKTGSIQDAGNAVSTKTDTYVSPLTFHVCVGGGRLVLWGFFCLFVFTSVEDYIGFFGFDLRHRKNT